jgi:hypothetical protein
MSGTYNFWTWLDENSEQVKLFFSGLIAVGVYYSAALPDVWKALLTLGSAMVSKALLDYVHLKANQNKTV